MLHDDLTRKIIKSFYKVYNTLGYGFLEKPADVVPPVKLTFYAFRIMVGLGFLFAILFGIFLTLALKNRIGNRKWLYYLSILCIPLAYIATQAGWIVVEVGRQPWVIQDLLPTVAAISHINASSVIVTFILFALLFTALLIAELSIMFKQIKIGPK